LIAGVRHVNNLSVVVHLREAVQVPDVLRADVLGGDVLRTDFVRHVLGADVLRCDVLGGDVVGDVLSDVDVHRYAVLPRDLQQTREVSAVLVWCEEGILWVRLSSMIIDQ
jgi:hypothetical protein